MDNNIKLLHVAYCNKSIIEEWKIGAKKEKKARKSKKKFEVVPPFEVKVAYNLANGNTKLWKFSISSSL